MKLILVLSSLLVFVAAETYSSENDDYDIKKEIEEANTLKAFLDCFNDKGGCDERSAPFKMDLPEAIAEACRKCTSDQKHLVKRFLEVTKVQNPEEFKIFEQKYDPKREHLAALEAAIANY